MDNKDCYSFDEEQFYNGDLCDAVTDFIDSGCCEGSEFIVYMGESVRPNLEDVINIHYVDETTDSIFEEFGDDAAEWFSDSLTYHHETSLNNHLKDAVREWRIRHGFDIRFFTAKNIEEVKVKITNADEYEYEVING